LEDLVEQTPRIRFGNHNPAHVCGVVVEATDLGSMGENVRVHVEGMGFYYFPFIISRP